MSTPQNLLSGLTVGLSISESPDIEALGFSDVHFKDMFIEFSRHMLANGVTLAYGGDFRKDGLTEILFDLKATYKGNVSRIASYLGWPIRVETDKLSDEQKLRYAKAAMFHESPMPEGVDASIPRDKFLPPTKTKLENMLVWARSMTKMRHDCLARLNDAQISLGGRMDGYSSKYPGVVEEAYEILKAEKPLYLIGAFGGATKAVIDAVLGGKPGSLTEEGQYRLWEKWGKATQAANAAKAKADLELAPQEIQAAEDAMKMAATEQGKKAAEKMKVDAETRLASAQEYDPATKEENYKGLVEYFNKNAPAPEERIDYSKLTAFFNEKGIAGLNNNLTEEENRRLFVTPHVAETIALVLKGLVRIRK
jgi:hypothetical protein